MNPQPKTIDITPTWAAILPAMLAVYETGDLDARSVVRKNCKIWRQVTPPPPFYLETKRHDDCNPISL
jgi:hypothetical protein